MVLSLMPGGEVEELVEKAVEHRMPMEQVFAIARDVCRGLEFAIGEFREMKMQPSLERELRHREILGA